MKDLVTKIGRFCENHVEKIVLVISAVICVWLFFTRVIFSPNVVTVEGRSLTPGQIDRYIFDSKAQELTAQMQRRQTGAGREYTPRLTGVIDPCDPVIAGVIDRPLPGGFAGLLESPLDFLEAAPIPKPATVTARRAGAASAGRRYRLPMIPDVTDAAVSHMRAAAYVPIQQQQPAGRTAVATAAAFEPADIDLVTVEARFNTADLYRRFQAGFNGVDVLREEWRDPSLADPVFAAVQLERQKWQEDGSWSDWQEVPRSRVESNRDLFQVIEQVDQLPPGGLDVRMMSFNRRDIRLSLLQPENYQIASAEEEWFPPTLYGKFRDLQRRVEAEERKEQREQSRPTDTRLTESRRRPGGVQGGLTPGAGRTGVGTGTTTGTGRTRPGAGVGGDAGLAGTRTRGPGAGRPGDPAAPGATRGRAGRGGDDLYDAYGGPGAGADGRRRPTTAEVFLDLREELLPINVDLSRRTDPVLIWAFDDTVEPGGMYRYRMRVGVFNPVAGTDQLVERDMDKRNQAILWSRYSEVTRPVAIPQMVYLFAKNVQDRTNSATVEVARYKMGYWRSEDFQVRPGEAIGGIVESREPERDRRERDRRTGPGPGGRDFGGDPMMGDMYAPPTQDEPTKPSTIDYSTGKMLVDLVEVNDWSDAPNLRPRTYHNMLYTSDGTDIQHMPVSMTNWPRDVAQVYQVIQAERRREPKPFRSYAQTRTRGGRGGDPYGGAYDDMYDMGGLYNR